MSDTQNPILTPPTPEKKMAEPPSQPRNFFSHGLSMNNGPLNNDSAQQSCLSGSSTIFQSNVQNGANTANNGNGAGMNGNRLVARRDDQDRSTGRSMSSKSTQWRKFGDASTSSNSSMPTNGPVMHRHGHSVPDVVDDFIVNTIVVKSEHFSAVIGKDGATLDEIVAKFPSVRVQYSLACTRSNMVTMAGTKAEVGKFSAAVHEIMSQRENQVDVSRRDDGAYDNLRNGASRNGDAFPPPGLGPSNKDKSGGANGWNFNQSPMNPQSNEFSAQEFIQGLTQLPSSQNRTGDFVKPSYHNFNEGNNASRAGSKVVRWATDGNFENNSENNFVPSYAANPNDANNTGQIGSQLAQISSPADSAIALCDSSADRSIPVWYLGRESNFYLPKAPHHVILRGLNSPLYTQSPLARAPRRRTSSIITNPEEPYDRVIREDNPKAYEIPRLEYQKWTKRSNDKWDERIDCFLAREAAEALEAEEAKNKLDETLWMLFRLHCT